ncbi:3-dehydroquinate dehydratase [Rubrivivax sp. A210]|uniref:type I 3-dehydroquinate dehydratase n=1 Tax=Rubrivivax sp. A210 TaxID=2772301 RepID=UPI001919CC46|nr:type I 3-dehydroquinate dehydratase [Rubrivivax sp. A210]CAD5375118.1 3-dehydroquinate dehydratase [Rubrivivax sp. A210]
MTTARPILLKGRPIADGAFPLIITPLVGRDAGAIQDELAAILPKRPDMLEWRVDFFEAIADTTQVIATALAIRAAAGGIPVLFTRRNVTEGGQTLPIAEPAVVALIAAVCEARCVELIDYELSNAPADLALLRRASAQHGIAMVMSFHNFQQTPSGAELDAKFMRARELGADVAKLAVMPRDPADVLTLLAATLRASQALDIPVISMSMGAIGSVSRMMGWIYGSAATFAVGKSSSAPGQVAIDELRAMLATVRKTTLGS